MKDKEQILITSDGKQPSSCSDYDENSGICKGTGKLCDMCYENSLQTEI